MYERVEIVVVYALNLDMGVLMSRRYYCPRHSFDSKASKKNPLQKRLLCHHANPQAAVCATRS